jgi:hypothetical protein
MANFKSFKLSEHLERAGATEAFGEEGLSTLERIWHRPTCVSVTPPPPPPSPPHSVCVSFAFFQHIGGVDFLTHHE